MEIQLDEDDIRIGVLILLLIIFCFFVLFKKTNVIYTNVSAEGIEEVSEVADDKEPWESLHPELVPICSCESSASGKANDIPRHYDSNGEVLLNYTTKEDVGYCQINLKYHLEISKEMGIDIYTPEGNVEYANYIHKEQGLAPWGWSRHCWQNTL